MFYSDIVGVCMSMVLVRGLEKGEYYISLWKVGYFGQQC